MIETASHASLWAVLHRLFTLLMLLGCAVPVSADSIAPINPQATFTPSTSVSASTWLQRYRQLAAEAPAGCPRVIVPSLDDHAPARAFSLKPIVDSSASGPLIAALKDPIAERFLVLTQSQDRCIQVGESGRSVAFAQRSISSPFPNSRLATRFGLTEPIAIVIDHKSVRPWITVLPEAKFRRLSERLWIATGMFAGMLATLFVIAILIVRYQRSALTLAYVGYIAALQLYLFQALGLGTAWLPFWPEPSSHHLLQAFAAGTAVIGMSLPVFAFLRPAGRLRRLLLSSVALSASGFYLSTLTAGAYRFGAAILPLLAVLSILLLAKRLRDDEPGTRWFALGLAAALFSGGLQATALVTQGAWLPPISAFAFPIGNVIGSMCWLIAILMRLSAENLALQQRLVFEAHHDPLTGMKSRAFMSVRLAQVIEEAKSSSHLSQGLIYIDLGGFKRLNDRFGQARGDQALRAFARTLSGLGLDADSIGRFGGDEFIVLMRAETHWGHTEGGAATILGRFRDALSIHGDSLLLRPDIALLRITSDYDSVDEIIQDASLALQISKQLGGRRATVFEPQMRERALTENANRIEIESAIRNHQLDLHYQPMVAFDSLSPVGFEALLRCEYLSEQGIGVEQIFAVAESAGLLNAISERVVDLALAQIAAWQRHGVWSADLFLSINVCEQQLIDGRFLEHLHRASQDLDIDTSAIRLELSEGLIGADLDWSRHILPRLLNQHILFGIDNFGSGAASLTMLTDLQPDYIKIDRRLVATLATSPRAQNLARAARLFTAESGSLAIAEGIETNAQLETLTELGYELGQGHLFAAPMSGAETASWLEYTARIQAQPSDQSGRRRQLH